MAYRIEYFPEESVIHVDVYEVTVNGVDFCSKDKIIEVDGLGANAVKKVRKHVIRELKFPKSRVEHYGNVSWIW